MVLRVASFLFAIVFASTQFVSAAGDVSIEYALEFFKRSAPSFSREAATLLSKLKGG